MYRTRAKMYLLDRLGRLHTSDGHIVSRDDSDLGGFGTKMPCEYCGGVLKLDLNEVTVLDIYNMGIYTTFDIVTNHGTTEHIFNQANVFELMHGLTKVGGMMIHAVPTPKFGPSHGFYFYDETIFDDMAHANNYQILQMYREPDPYEIILVAFKRLRAEPFKMPIQGQYRT